MATDIMRWDPFTELEEMRSRIDRVFGGDGSSGGRWMPAVDVLRQNGNLVVRADIPGITPDEVTIEVENGILTVSGSHEESRESGESRYVRRERRRGAFARSMVLPEGVDAGSITAHTADGVVEVTIPLPEAQKPAGRVTITPTAG
jgi:HSP20 family protein